MIIAVTGANGFVGRHTVARLAAQGEQVAALVRGDAPRSTAANVRFVGSIDITDRSTLLGAFDGVDAVVHLVGIIAERPPLQTFNRIHVQGTRNVVESAQQAGVKKILYVSAIGSAPDAESEYSRTKYAAEEIVRASGIEYTILRPSIVLGKDGEFAQQMRELVRSGGLPLPIPAPIIPVPGSGRTLFQPMYVEDLADCVAKSVVDGAAGNESVAVAGAEQVSFNDIVGAFAAAEGVRNPMLHVPLGLLRLIAPLIEKLPKPPFTADQLKNLAVDNVADIAPMRQAFGIEPIGFAEIMRRIGV